MRVTLTLDDDVLTAAKALAARQRRSLGAVVSELARQTLLQPRPAREAALPAARARIGRFAIFPPRDEVVSASKVRALTDSQGG